MSTARHVPLRPVDLGRRAFALSLAGLLLSLAAPAWAEEPSAQQIVDRAVADNAFGFKSGQARLTLTVKDRSGEERTRKLDVKSKKVEGLVRTRVALTEPAEVRGQAFLFVQNKGSEDDVWMYLPAFSVTRRVEASQKRGAFMGTHFTFADLESRDLKDAQLVRQKDESIGQTPVYVVHATPKSGAASDYSRVEAFVRKSDFLPLRIRFYGRGGKLEKTLFVEKLDKTAANQTYIRQMTLRSEAGGHTTIITEGLDSTAELADSLFTREQLAR